MVVPFPALKTMVTVFLLLMGNTSPVVPKESIPLSRVKVIAAKVVKNGDSFHGGSLKDVADPNYKVTCAIQVENWTKFPLINPIVRIANDGAVTVYPVLILPGRREAFAVRKAAYVRRGVYGTVSWELEGARRRFVLMWSAPDNFRHYSNWMGLGMTREGVVIAASGNKWFHEMYYEKSNQDLTFTRKEYFYNTDPLVYSNDKFEVEGTMTNGHKAEVRVVVRPTSNNWDLLADPIRELVQQEQE